MPNTNPIDVKIDSKALALLHKAGRANLNLQPVLPEIAAIIQASIDYNFQVGGRYGDGEYGGGSEKWKPYKPYWRKRGDTYKLRAAGGLTLIDTGALRASVQVTYGVSSIIIASNDEGFTTHHFGDVRPIFGGPQIGVFPARPIVVLQDEDIEDITEVITENLNKILQLE